MLASILTSAAIIILVAVLMAPSTANSSARIVSGSGKGQRGAQQSRYVTPAVTTGSAGRGACHS